MSSETHPHPSPLLGCVAQNKDPAGLCPGPGRSPPERPGCCRGRGGPRLMVMPVTLIGQGPHREDGCVLRLRMGVGCQFCLERRWDGDGHTLLRAHPDTVTQRNSETNCLPGRGSSLRVTLRQVSFPHPEADSSLKGTGASHQLFLGVAEAPLPNLQLRF